MNNCVIAVLLGILAIITFMPRKAFGHSGQMGGQPSQMSMPSGQMGSELGEPSPLGTRTSQYYQQHSHYPMGAWWIPESDPSMKCHLKARTQCHNQFNYDNCYRQQFDQCTQQTPYVGNRPPNPDLIAY
jgi:hypothetical protein